MTFVYPRTGVANNCLLRLDQSQKFSRFNLNADKRTDEKAEKIKVLYVVLNSESTLSRKHFCFCLSILLQTFQMQLMPQGIHHLETDTPRLFGT